MKIVSILKSYLPNFSALHPMTFSIISSIYWLFCDDGEQQPKVSHFPSERSRVGAAEVSESQDRRKVSKSGGGINCNVLGISLPWNKFKVEKILKGSLHLISSPSPSVKIQNYRQESLLEM